MLSLVLFFLDYIIPCVLIVLGLVWGWRCFRFLLYARRRLRQLGSDGDNFFE